MALLIVGASIDENQAVDWRLTEVDLIEVYNCFLYHPIVCDNSALYKDTKEGDSDLAEAVIGSDHH